MRQVEFALDFGFRRVLVLPKSSAFVTERDDGERTRLSRTRERDQDVCQSLVSASVFAGRDGLYPNILQIVHVSTSSVG